MTILVYAGDKTPLLNLDDVLRYRHDDEVEAARAEIEARKKVKATLSSEVDFKRIGESIDEMKTAVARSDGLAVNDIARRILIDTAGKSIAEPAPYVVDEFAALTSVQFVAISDVQFRDAMGVMKQAVTDEDIVAAMVNMIRLTVCRLVVDGNDISALKDDDLEALRLTGLFVPLYIAARDYQRLTARKKKRFGSPLP